MEPNPPAQQLEPEDFYMEGPTLVFTAVYHLKRGSCCGSGCRHCPYGQAAERKAEAGPSTPVAAATSAQDDIR